MSALAAWFGRSKNLAVVFVLCALPAGLGCAWLTPMGMHADEPAHICRADGLRFGQVFGRPAPLIQPNMPVTAGVMVSGGVFAVLFDQEYLAAYRHLPITQAARQQAEAIQWGGSEFCLTQMVEYFPVFYVPASLALALGQAAGVPPVYALHLARVAMLLGYLALGAAALALARAGQAWLFAWLTMPTAINLAASCSQDGLIIAAAAFAAAWLTRGGRLGALAALSAVAAAKAPYAPLLALGLAPWRGGSKIWRRTGAVALAALPPALWLLHLAHAGFMPWRGTPYHPGPLWPGSRTIWLDDTLPWRNLLVLREHPIQILILPLRSAVIFWRMSGLDLFGVVAFDSVRLDAWEYPGLIAACAIAGLGAICGANPWARLEAGFAALVLFLAFLSVELGLYLTFTEAGWDWIEGLKARYFLPLLPFAILVLPLAGGLAPGLRRLGAGWFTLPAVGMAAINAAALPLFIYRLYGMPGP